MEEEVEGEAQKQSPAPRLAHGEAVNSTSGGCAFVTSRGSGARPQVTACPAGSPARCMVGISHPQAPEVWATAPAAGGYLLEGLSLDTEAAVIQPAGACPACVCLSCPPLPEQL